MNKAIKTKFVDGLIETVKTDILKNIDKMPADWDGAELQWFIREHFEQVVFKGFRDKKLKRYKDFENYCLTNNLY